MVRSFPLIILEMKPLDRIKAGWPETKGELSHLVLPFFDVRDELSVCDGIVIRGETVTLRFYHRDWIEK